MKFKTEKCKKGRGYRVVSESKDGRTWGVSWLPSKSRAKKYIHNVKVLRRSKRKMPRGGW